MIVAAAIRQDGKIYTGLRHCYIISEMVHRFHLHPPIKGEQGFVDEAGVFYDRHTAGVLAIREHQIEKLKWPGMGLDSSEVFPRKEGEA